MTYVHVHCRMGQVVAMPAYHLNIPIYGVYWNGFNWYSDWNAAGMLNFEYSFMVGRQTVLVK